MSRQLKFRVSEGTRFIGYEQVFDGRWYSSAGGTDWASGTYSGPRLKRWQDTGLGDKKGDQIYEGDICEFPYLQDDGSSEQEVDKVSFENGEFVLFKWPLKQWALKCIVIGNVYENPELLK